jgi:putative redox protein
MDTTKIKSQFQGDNYTTLISNGTHQITADEPIEDGGQDKGLNPFELILAGLAACTTATLKMYADRKTWNIKKIDITITMIENEKVQAIKTDITIDGDFSEEQKARLLVIAKKCPVHKLLSMGNQIETILH